MSRSGAGVVVLLVGVALVTQAVWDTTPWQAGFAAGLLLMIGGYSLMTPRHCHDCDDEIPHGRYCSGCSRKRRLRKKGLEEA